MGTVLITGAAGGIGLELTRHYLRGGHQVFAVCRKATAELNASGATVIANIDVIDEQSYSALTQSLSGIELDILINNAGVFGDNTLGSIDYENIEYQFKVNAVAPLRVTEALLSSLKPGSKIAMITSRMGSIADNGSGAYYGYRMSKAALNAAGVSLARDLAGKGIAVGLFHPGFVQTRMVGFAGDISPELSAQRLAQRIEALSLQNTGGFWHSSGDKLPW
ncbi:SDR family oxidoreductase [Cellvibrio polysaccharolyticus]|uniref:SDR family NAD(P)-dependent oxidoreductase n=1 Tax=Cellvibrio polysaccharolyticus TaxID=2082724 RepID=A0A928YVM1_9GAMM|nr:SDR family oxidoreductase [Cellvibrio polysaccharolyticus]MBE8717223.1 SDR family NAD(P)-dependent oxidoreductase [Cellvibrio polysaccharolyticus]